MGSPEPVRTLTLPRGLIVLCCLWIAISWLILFGVHPPIQPVAASYSDAVIMMITSTMLGISIAWPLLRTSGRRFTLPLRQTLLDMIVLACAVQVIVWPIRLVSTWSVMQTVLIAGVLCAWIVMFGAIVRFGAASDRAAIRTTMMLLAILIVIVGALLSNGDGDSWWSPLNSVIAAAQSRQNIPTPSTATGIATTSISGIGLWILLTGARKALEPSGDRDSQRVDSA